MELLAGAVAVLVGEIVVVGDELFESSFGVSDDGESSLKCIKC